MRKHLKYIEGTADKFWQIETTDVSFTVTYGKNGTSGTTQTKAFDTAAECLKTAEKLLAEKIKKGYSESGEVDAATIATAKPKTEKQPAQKNDLQLVLAEFDGIIADRKVSALLPFLKEKSNGNKEGLKTQIKKAKRFWMTYVDLSNEPQFKENSTYDWGQRGDDVQARIINLAALALFDKTEIASWDEVFNILNQLKDKTVFDIVEWAKPNWLDTFLLDKVKKQDWLTYHYSNLRLLEAHELIAYNPELFALSVCKCISELSYDQKTNKKVMAHIEILLADAVACRRDIPEIFNYETSVNNQTHSLEIEETDEAPSTDRQLDKSGIFNYVRSGNKQNKVEKKYEDFSIWDKVFTRLLEENKIDRQFFIENCLQIQTKEWNNNLKLFFRKRLEELNVQPDELLPFQETIFTFLHAAYPPIVTCGVDNVKQFYQNEAFNTASFLGWVAPTMMRSDCKAAIKTLLPMLEKMDKVVSINGVDKRPYRREISAVIADVFVIADMSLQERAAKVLLKIAEVKDGALKGKLLEYAPLMQGQIKSTLGGFFEETDFLASDTEGYETYEFASQQSLFLTEKVVLPTDWNAILFQVGKFITSQEVLDAEILLNVFTTQRHLFPADFSEQLDPYFGQLSRYFESAHKNVLSAFLLQKIVNFNKKFVCPDNHYNQIKTLALFSHIVVKVDNKVGINSTLPLLSMPTHAPYWVEPKVLIERLIAYQTAKEGIDRVDLCIAISRMPRENTEEAAQLLSQLDPDMAKLMAFCLGTSQTIDVSDTASMFSKVLSFVGGSTQKTENVALWAVAARTVYPKKTFREFEKTYLSNVPFVVEPFNPKPYFIERWNDYKNYQTNIMERSASWFQLHFKSPKAKTTPNYLLYSLDIFEHSANWDPSLGCEDNVYYWHSIMPQNPEALGFKLLKSVCALTSFASNELKAYLNILNRPEFWFSDGTMLTFACCFFREKKDIRFMASEVLITLIQNQTINAEELGKKFAFLISEKYGVLLRFIDALIAIKDVSPLHNSALFIILDTMFQHLVLDDKMPTNFKKMVENYADIISKTAHKPSQEALGFFEKLGDNASLKGLIKQINMTK